MLDPIGAGQCHGHLLGASKDTTHGLHYLPVMLSVMIGEEGWREMVRPIDGRIFIVNSLEEWLLGPPWPGLDFKTWDMLYAILARSADGRDVIRLLVDHGAPTTELQHVGTDDAEVKQLQREVVKTANPQGKHRASPGNARSYEHDASHVLAKLKRDRPELAERVVKGELSAHAAAIEAGFRRKTWSAPVDVEQLREAIERRYAGWTIKRK